MILVCSIIAYCAYMYIYDIVHIYIHTYMIIYVIFWNGLSILKTARDDLRHHFINKSSEDAQTIPRIDSCGEPRAQKIQGLGLIWIWLVIFSTKKPPILGVDQ